jgi:hypothetical protein
MPRRRATGMWRGVQRWTTTTSLISKGGSRSSFNAITARGRRIRLQR